ncbi:hypothetical protein M2418_002678 [Rhizobium sp. BIGb0125]|nr:hypothetical protein [Rhizobium sp. BIGb0125]
MLRHFIILAAATSVQHASASETKTVLQPAPLEYLCAEQDHIVAIWQNQNVIWAVELERKPPTLTVNRRQWLGISANHQSSIALASYCRLGAVDGAAEMQVVDTGGSLFGVVREGKWKNRLTGE